MEQLSVNAGAVRTEFMGGREYFVAPMTILKHGVLAGSKGPLYYPEAEILSTVNHWNMMPIVVYHPQSGGMHVSARSPGILDKQWIGHVLNARYKGDKLRAEGWFDKEKTQRVDVRVYNALKSGTPVSLSTGLYTDNEDTPGVFNGRQYAFVARNYRPDHLAILPDQMGACDIADGCGVLVNAWDEGRHPRDEKGKFAKKDSVPKVKSLSYASEAAVTVAEEAASDSALFASRAARYIPTYIVRHVDGADAAFADAVEGGVSFDTVQEMHQELAARAEELQNAVRSAVTYLETSKAKISGTRVSERREQLIKQGNELIQRLEEVRVVNHDAAIDAVENAYNPDQPRDDHGRWTDDATHPRAPIRRVAEESGHADAAGRGNVSGHVARRESFQREVAQHSGLRLVDEDLEASRSAVAPSVEALSETERWIRGGELRKHDHISSIRLWASDADAYAQDADQLSEVASQEATPEGKRQGYKDASSMHLLAKNRHEQVADYVSKRYKSEHAKHVVKLHRDAAALHYDAAQMLVGNAYNPDQPRDDHGRWTSHGSNQQFRGGKANDFGRRPVPQGTVQQEATEGAKAAIGELYNELTNFLDVYQDRLAPWLLNDLTAVRSSMETGLQFGAMPNYENDYTPAKYHSDLAADAHDTLSHFDAFLGQFENRRNNESLKDFLADSRRLRQLAREAEYVNLDAAQEYTGNMSWFSQCPRNERGWCMSADEGGGYSAGGYDGVKAVKSQVNLLKRRYFEPFDYRKAGYADVDTYDMDSRLHELDYNIQYRYDQRVRAAKKAKSNEKHVAALKALVSDVNSVLDGLEHQRTMYLSSPDANKEYVEAWYERAQPRIQQLRELAAIAHDTAEELTTNSAEQHMRRVDNYDPDQPRDDHGRWTKVFGAAVGALGDAVRSPLGQRLWHDTKQVFKAAHRAAWGLGGAVTGGTSGAGLGAVLGGTPGAMGGLAAGVAAGGLSGLQTAREIEDMVSGHHPLRAASRLLHGVGAGIAGAAIAGSIAGPLGMKAGWDIGVKGGIVRAMQGGAAGLTFGTVGGGAAGAYVGSKLGLLASDVSEAALKAGLAVGSKGYRLLMDAAKRLTRKPELATNAASSLEHVLSDPAEMQLFAKAIATVVANAAEEAVIRGHEQLRDEDGKFARKGKKRREQKLKAEGTQAEQHDKMRRYNQQMRRVDNAREHCILDDYLLTTNELGEFSQFRNDHERAKVFLSLLEPLSHDVLVNYDPSQPRDNSGRWTSGSARGQANSLGRRAKKLAGRAATDTDVEAVYREQKRIKRLKKQVRRAATDTEVERADRALQAAERRLRKLKKQVGDTERESVRNSLSEDAFMSDLHQLLTLNLLDIQIGGQRNTTHWFSTCERDEHGWCKAPGGGGGGGGGRGGRPRLQGGDDDDPRRPGGGAPGQTHGRRKAHWQTDAGGYYDDVVRPVLDTVTGGVAGRALAMGSSKFRNAYDKTLFDETKEVMSRIVKTVAVGGGAVAGGLAAGPVGIAAGAAAGAALPYAAKAAFAAAPKAGELLWEATKAAAGAVGSGIKLAAKAVTRRQTGTEGSAADKKGEPYNPEPVKLPKTSSEVKVSQDGGKEPYNPAPVSVPKSDVKVSYEPPKDSNAGETKAVERPGAFELKQTTAQAARSARNAKKSSMKNRARDMATAARRHREAAEVYDRAGDTEKADNYRKLAEEFDAKSKLTYNQSALEDFEVAVTNLWELLVTNEREREGFVAGAAAALESLEAAEMSKTQTIGWLTANCDCWKGPHDAEVLANFSEEKLARMKAAAEKSKAHEAVVNAVAAKYKRQFGEGITVNNMPKYVANNVRCGGMEAEGAEGEPTGEESMPKKPGMEDEEEPTGNRAEQLWLRSAPPSVRADLEYARQVRVREKQGLVNRIVANANGTPEQIAELKGSLMQKPQAELQRLLLLAAPAPVHNSDNFNFSLNAPGMFVANDADDFLPLPSMAKG